MSDFSTIKLTEYSHGAGCGCKISPQILDTILKTNSNFTDGKLLVGNSSKDDAAAYDLGDGSALLSTTDFFMPIVDDAFDFGRIAATNAISDIYAMGGQPLMAIAILGWPVSKLPPELAQQVLEGARYTCKEAGIMLAGGHSIDAPEPIFGLAVSGRVAINQLKRNDTAKAGDRLYLTKPLGVGILTTAQKQKKLQPDHAMLARDSMVQLNRIGTDIASLRGINAMTDVTGFGLLGHLMEMCEGSAVDAVLAYDAVPVLPNVIDYLNKGCIPGGSARNFASYGAKVSPLNEAQQAILCDPQTSGGLLLAVSPQAEAAFRDLALAYDLILEPIGELTSQGNGHRIRLC
ncbi:MULTISPECIES: selenide, water dikinase SelD [unclassified Arsukibacterium]|uniref:selenide, water dikinase SelD n=1 Tax=unclassified Arsukibacterium TaxID=2635278 RepID=UPI000C4D99B2|nr:MULTISPECIES: selenide, water dikinase SelD [unclassified Arsukibacterium]MAA95194.1 selenide, water dikinase SelD [Rheinheimera sp.]MBM35131.1 selenide, water dikinase SelD [Rheinheimera sp.]HAW93502.1 selenide, water dikinase SelD [Candidatus Azambacteria bacterium]|tara:strand:+ start:11253 stop:12293 length:1041 start_codon:yes stop_codon:yes gene_type:complete